MVSNSSQGEGTSSALTTSFSNMEGSQGEDSSVVFSDRSGAPILKNTGYVAIGTFELSREEIGSLSSASDLDTAFNQFGAATNFNSIENGAFQGSASGDPALPHEGLSPFAGSKVYIVIGNGSDLITSSEFLVWDSGMVFDGTGPTGGPWEVVLSVDRGDLIIGYSDKNTSDFSAIGGDAARAAFTTKMIDTSLDDHGDSEDAATFITANSTTSGEIKDGDDIDYFRIDLSEDGNLFVRINQNLELTLYDDDRNVLEVIQDGGEGLGDGVAAEFMINKDLAAGTYYVSIGGDENTSNVDYNLESEFQEKIIDLDPESAGSYYGLVKDKKGNMIGRLTITITQDGVYSGKLDGINRSKVFFKGFIKSDYTAAASTRNIFWRLSTIGFSISQSDSGYYRIAGHFQNLSDVEPNHFFYGLRKSIYNANNPLPWSMRGRYTMLMPSPSTTDEGLPAGDGFAVGNMWRAGVLKLWGYSNSGAKFSYSSPMLEGDEVIFFTRPYGGLEALLGKIWFRNWWKTDFKGKLRYARKPKNGTYYPDKFDKVLTAEGSRYRRPSTDELPLNSFSVADNNAVAEFVGGVFDGGRYSLTWNADGSMETTSTAIYSASATFNNKNGQFSGKYIVTPSNEGAPDVTTYLRGVVLQKKGVVSGQAETEDNGVGRYSVVPAP